jgi:hypothetical protein
MGRLAAALLVCVVQVGCHLVCPFSVTPPASDSLADTSPADASPADASPVDAPPVDAPPGDSAIDLPGPAGDASPSLDTQPIDTGPLAPVTITNALSGPTGTKTGTGVVLSTEFWPGWRFEVPPGKSFVTSAVGIHVWANSADLSIFGSLVALTGPTDEPDKFDLSGPDVIATTLFEMAPSALGSQNVSGALSATLSPGWYAVIFGSGRAGAKGQGNAFGNNTKLAGVDNIFVLKQSTQGISYTGEVARLFVEGTFQ